jgi:hypothetical protein
MKCLDLVLAWLILLLAGPHVCLQDSTGRTTWWRLAPVDVWGGP